MSDSAHKSPDNRGVTSITATTRYGDWPFEERIVSHLGAGGAELEARSFAAHEALRAALGCAGFGLLDAYVSAATAVACAREAAISELCSDSVLATIRA